MTEKRYRLWLIVSYLAGVFALAFQPILSLLSSASQGMLPYRGHDESLYLIRLQEGLLSPTADTTNGIWSAPFDTVGMQMAFMERVAGWLFGWTGLDALWVAFIITIFAAPTAILLFAAIFRRCKLSPGLSILFAVLLFIDLGLLRRYFNPSWSMPIMMTAVLLLWRTWDHQRPRDAIAAGVLLGILPGVYFWSWTYGWAVAGILGVYAIDGVRQKDGIKRVQMIGLAGLVTVLTSLPFLWRIYETSHLPLFGESSLRMGMMYSREFESYPRSFLLLLVAGGTYWIFRKKEDRVHLAPVLSMVLAAFIVMHQQFLHGRIMSFSSHYYMSVCIAAAVAIAAFIGHKRIKLASLVATFAALVLFAGAWSDYRGRLTVFGMPSVRAMSFQHLASAMKLLDDGRTDVILTDSETANIIASVTDDDVVYTNYSKILVVSTMERAQRYCLSNTLSPGPINTGFLADYDDEESVAARPQAAWLYDRHLEITQEACAWVREDLRRALAHFGVTKILWNERERPEWVVDPMVFTLEEQGEGWSLWTIRGREVRR